MFQEEKRSNTGIIVSISILLVVAAAAGFWFYKKNNHAAIEATVTRVEVAPLHVQYAHVYGNAGKDQTDDATYIVARVRIDNRMSNAPLFLKDINATLQPNGYEAQTTTALEQADLENVTRGIAPVREAAARIGGHPLLREIKIEPNATVEGYAVFQFKGEPKIWNERESASVNLDFYHNQTATAAIPK